MADPKLVTFTPATQSEIAEMLRDWRSRPKNPVPPARAPGTPLPFQFRRFELIEDLPPGGTPENPSSALAYELTAVGTVNTDLIFRVTDILGTRLGLGNGTLSAPYNRGSQGTCYHPHDVDRWEIIDMQAINMMRFELKYDLAPGGTVDAYYLTADGSIAAGVTFPVTDFLGVHRGRGEGTLTSPNDRGSQGYAWYFHDIGRFEILKLQPHALRITGLADGTVAEDDDTLTLSNVQIMQPTGALAMEDLTADGLVENAFGWAIDNTGRVDAVWNETAGKWQAAQAECPAAEPE